MKTEEALRDQYLCVMSVDKSGLCRCQNHHEHWGLCFPDGRPVLSPSYLSIGDYNGSGWPAVCLDKHPLFITPKKLILFCMAYDSAKAELTAMFPQAVA